MHIIHNTGAIGNSLKIISGYAKQYIILFSNKESIDKYNATIDTILESCHKTLNNSIITNLKIYNWKPSSIYLSIPSFSPYESISKPVPNLQEINRPMPALIPYLSTFIRPSSLPSLHISKYLSEIPISIPS